VNNLGVADPAPFAELTGERWARAFDINLMGCIGARRALLLGCKRSGPRRS